MSYHVLDLGLAANIVSSLGIGGWSFKIALTQLSNQGLDIIFYPHTFFQMMPSMLIVQSFAIGFLSLLLFEISYKELKNPFILLAISGSYLPYFPLAGVNWLDFYFQNFFLIFFLAGYLLFQRNRFFWTTILFILSGLVSFPYIRIVVLSSLSLLLSTLPEARYQASILTIRRTRWMVVSFVVAT